MMTAVGVLVPSCCILLDRLGIPLPNLNAIDRRFGLPSGLMSSILVASVAMGLALVLIGIERIRRSSHATNRSTAWREEFRGWISLAAGANLPAFAIIGLTSIAILL